jgi:hypothetical protein
VTLFLTLKTTWGAYGPPKTSPDEANDPWCFASILDWDLLSGLLQEEP